MKAATSALRVEKDSSGRLGQEELILTVLRSIIARDGIVPLRVLGRALNGQFAFRASFDAVVARLVSVGQLDMVYGEGFETSVRLKEVHDR